MGRTNSGPLGNLTFVRYSIVNPDGAGSRFIKVIFNIDTESSIEEITGFRFWHDGEIGSTSPDFDNGPSSAIIPSVDGYCHVLLPVSISSTSPVVFWESFEEYGLNHNVDNMNLGGVIWDGAFQHKEVYRIAEDDFENYTIGPIGNINNLNSGENWDGAWSGRTL